MPKQLAILLHNSEFWHSLSQLLNNNSVSTVCKVPAMQFCLDVQTECFPFFGKHGPGQYQQEALDVVVVDECKEGFIFKQIQH